MTPRRTRLLHRSPWMMLIALVASVPAFYDSMMPTPATWATWMYLISGTVVVWTTWQARRARLASGARATDEPSLGFSNLYPHTTQEGLDWFLGFGLLLSAVLPQSNVSHVGLAWRLVIALLLLYRLVIISLPLFTQTGLARLLAMGGTVLGLCGIGFYWLDPEVDSLNEGLWLAFSTAATVGYGDVVPSTTASRIFSVFVVLLGYGLLSLVTASIAAMFVGTQERRVEREILRDMHKEITSLRAEIEVLRQTVAAQPAPPSGPPEPLSADASAASPPRAEA
jgi:voltage-gated potassium channel